MISTPSPVLRALRVAGLIAMLAGAAGSVGLTLYMGRHNPSRLLIGAFVAWVLSPFVALWFADTAGSRWAAPTRATLYGAMLTVTLASLLIYGAVALGPPRRQPAFFFLTVPPACWLLSAIAVGLAARIAQSPRQSRL